MIAQARQHVALVFGVLLLIAYPPVAVIALGWSYWTERASPRWVRVLIALLMVMSLLAAFGTLDAFSHHHGVRR